jgi:SAM-dependent methyltransferase
MPERAGRFAGAMKWLGHAPAFSPQGLVNLFPWEPESDSSQFTVVDVGGGLGHVSHALAASEHGSKAHFVVQDLADIVDKGQSALPGKGLQEKIHFQVHDFFEEQPVHGADVYLLRMILHDWSDKYGIKILRALVPALKPGAKVVINDRVIPGRHQVHYLVEREAR